MRKQHIKVDAQYCMSISVYTSLHHPQATKTKKEYIQVLKYLYIVWTENSFVLHSYISNNNNIALNHPSKIDMF